MIANQRSARLGPQRPIVTKVRRAKRDTYGKLNRRFLADRRKALRGGWYGTPERHNFNLGPDPG